MWAVIQDGAAEAITTWPQAAVEVSNVLANVVQIVMLAYLTTRLGGEPRH